MDNEISLLPKNQAEAFNLAENMASGQLMTPDHFRNKPADCLALIIKSAELGINPFTLAEKTYVIKGKLHYDAQLTIALVQKSGKIKGSFKYEYKNENTPNLSCRCGAIIQGEDKITWGGWLSIKQVLVKNSPLWQSNPVQQLSYLQAKNFSRLYCPDAISGMYSRDEFDVIPAKIERDITPPPPNSQKVFDKEAAVKGLNKYRAGLIEGDITFDEIMDKVHRIYDVVEDEAVELLKISIDDLLNK